MKPNKTLFLELINTNETSTHDFTNVLLPWETLFHANISIALSWSSLSSLRSLFCFSYFLGHGWWMAKDTFLILLRESSLAPKAILDQSFYHMIIEIKQMGEKSLETGNLSCSNERTCLKHKLKLINSKCVSF